MSRSPLVLICVLMLASPGFALGAQEGEAPAWKEVTLSVVTLAGSVKRPGAYHPTLPDQTPLTLRRLISAAGGFTAERVTIRIVRPVSESRSLVWEATCDDADEAAAHDIELKAGDAIEVRPMKQD